MKRTAVAAFVGAVLALAWWALPDVPRPAGESAGGAHAGHASEGAALTLGVIVSVDRGAASVTISHGQIANLGMSGMTMGFRVSDPALLESVNPGDKVRFHADIVGGVFTVTRMEPAN